MRNQQVWAVFMQLIYLPMQLWQRSDWYAILNTQVMHYNVEYSSGFIHLSWEAPFHQSLTKSRKFCQISAKISKSTIFYIWHSFPQVRFPWPTHRNGLVVFKPVRNKGKGTWLSSARLQFNRGPHRRFHWNILSVSFSNYGAVFILCFAAAYLSVLLSCQNARVVRRSCQKFFHANDSSWKSFWGKWDVMRDIFLSGCVLHADRAGIPSLFHLFLAPKKCEKKRPKNTVYSNSFGPLYDMAVRGKCKIRIK